MFIFLLYVVCIANKASFKIKILQNRNSSDNVQGENILSKQILFLFLFCSEKLSLVHQSSVPTSPILLIKRDTTNFFFFFFIEISRKYIEPRKNIITTIQMNNHSYNENVLIGKIRTIADLYYTQYSEIEYLYKCPFGITECA